MKTSTLEKAAGVAYWVAIILTAIVVGFALGYLLTNITLSLRPR